MTCFEKDIFQVCQPRPAETGEKCRDDITHSQTQEAISIWLSNARGTEKARESIQLVALQKGVAARVVLEQSIKNADKFSFLDVLSQVVLRATSSHVSSSSQH